MKPLLLIAGLIGLLISGCATSRTQPKVPSKRTSLYAPTPNDPNELVIVATSDFHASLERGEGLAAVIRDLRTVYGSQMIYLDGGDLFQGSLEGNMSKGRSIVAFFNALGLDAAAIGNHDLDYGPDVPGRISVRAHEDGLGTLKKRAREAKYQWISSNFVKDKVHPCRLKNGDVSGHCNALGERTVFKPHAFFDRAGRKVCVIGATTPVTASITRPEFVKHLRFDALKSVIEAEALFLRQEEECQFVLLTAHAGLQCEPHSERCLVPGDRADILNLLNAIKPGTLDAVVAGHTHQLAQEVINGTPVIEAGSNGKNVGVLHLGGTHEHPKSHFDHFIPVPANATQPDITAILKPYREAARERKTRVVGSTKEAFVRNYREENPLNNMIADSILAAGRAVDKVDFALNNAGSLRADLPAGTLTYGDVYAVQPFDNSLSIVTLRGAELRRVLEIALSGEHGTGGISGLRVKKLAVAPGLRGPWDRDLNGDGKVEDWERSLLVEITDNKGKPIDDNQMYKVALSDFLVDGGDHQGIVFNSIPDSRKRTFQDIWMRDVIVDYLRNRPNIDPENYFSPSHPRIQNAAPSK